MSLFTPYKLGFSMMLMQASHDSFIYPFLHPIIHSGGLFQDSSSLCTISIADNGLYASGHTC